MTRCLRRALLLIALSCAACEGTETGNPDLSAPHDAGSHGRGDAGVEPERDGGEPRDASAPHDASARPDAGAGQDGGAHADAAAPDDGGTDEDGGF